MISFIIKLIRNNLFSQNYEGQSPALSEYDFVIVGSGPAGCVLANRLSENPKWKILLLEAGKPENLAHFIPSIAAYLQSTESNWNYLAERSDQFCLGNSFISHEFYLNNLNQFKFLCILRYGRTKVCFAERKGFGRVK